jgi:hypothetical protein
MEMDIYSKALGRPCFFNRESDSTLIAGDALIIVRQDSFFKVIFKIRRQMARPAF